MTLIQMAAELRKLANLLENEYIQNRTSFMADGRGSKNEKDQFKV